MPKRCDHAHVNPGAATRNSGGWRHVLRVGLSLAACAALLWWLLFSVFLAVFRCGDNCAGAEAEHWRWAAQLAIAAVGSGLGVSALVLGFTAKQRRYRACVTVSTGCVVVWVGWVFVGGNF